MVSGNLKDIKNFISLDERIKNIDKYENKECKTLSSFYVDDKATNIFIVKKGKALFSTSWRDNENNNTPTCTLTLSSKSFALFLPGEKIAYKVFDNSTLINKRLLDD